jgi:group I intron endonuclease
MDTYRATNTTNGRFYVGSTTNFEKRRKEHLRSKKNLPFQNALRKNPEDFEWEVWTDDCDEPVLEQALLDTWFGKECCYNLNPFADRGPSNLGIKRPEHSKRMSGENNPMFGKTGELCPSHRRTGPLNPMFGKVGELHHNYGKTGEGNARSKKVEVTHPDGKVETYPCTKAVGKELSCFPSDVSRWCRENYIPTKGKFKGFVFRYIN